ncbi:hypothetical protein ACFSSC_05560 [Corynebacterium mendelii]|uniref:Uncharacterized protein n=1 Tax=Corynebacterium mendelii TaxID=2765362 RepID=A0A939IWZ4_9CORY|nr:hypothetical protein [Corynebacterium mendelii]MBN9643132.1 hypothetical protein [Corynebacterium mendelii]
MTAPDIRRRTTAVIVALCVLFGLTMAGQGTAHAAFDGVVKGFADSRDVATIDPDHPASLTIVVQHENPYNGPDKYGRLPGSPAGYQVVATRIPGLDLTDPSTWSKLGDYAFGNKEIIATGTRYNAVTGTNGLAIIDPLPVGAYYIQVTPPKDDEHRFFEIDPMVVTVPVGGDKDWNYQVQVAVKGVGFTRPYPPEEEQPPLFPPELLIPAISIPILVWLIPLLPALSSGASVPPPPAPAPTPAPQPEPEKPRPNLAITGSPVDTVMAVSLLVMLLGGVLVIASTRRSQRSRR